MTEEEGRINRDDEVEAWIEDDHMVIVVHSLCGGYYEETIQLSEILRRWGFVPLGA
jgi:hypothetical protein